MRVRGFTLLEVMIAITVSIGVLALTAALGQQLMQRSRAEAVVSDIRRVASEVRRLYGNSPTGYAGITNASLKASTSAMDDLWEASTTRFQAGSSTLDVSPQLWVPGPTLTTTAGSSFGLTVVAEPGLCRDIVQSLRADTVMITSNAGTGVTFNAPSPQAATAATIDAACTTANANVTLVLMFN